MRALLLAALLFVPLFAHAGGPATFTWEKPDPKFDSPHVNPAWDISEYRIYCVNADAVETAIVVPGYDTENYSAPDLPAGPTTCYMTSYSPDSNSESPPSASVTKTIYEDADPNSPAGFDFTAG